MQQQAVCVSEGHPLCLRGSMGYVCEEICLRLGEKYSLQNTPGFRYSEELKYPTRLPEISCVKLLGASGFSKRASSMQNELYFGNEGICEQRGAKTSRARLAVPHGYQTVPFLDLSACRSSRRKADQILRILR